MSTAGPRCSRRAAARWHRIAWFPVYAAVLCGFVVLARRFETPWKGVPAAVRVCAGVLAAGFGAYAVAVSG